MAFKDILYDIFRGRGREEERLLLKDGDSVGHVYHLACWCQSLAPGTSQEHGSHPCPSFTCVVALSS